MRPPEMGAADGLNILLSPVAYFNDKEVEQQFLAVIKNINGNLEFLKTLGRDRLKMLLFYTLASAAVSLKHIGFSEEKEWRVIYFPQVNPSPLISSAIEAVDGIPQLIYKIPLEENPDNNVIGVGIPALIDRIIIGPTVYPAPIYGAFVEALRQAEVPDPEKRVAFSGIPIRS